MNDSKIYVITEKDIALTECNYCEAKIGSTYCRQDCKYNQPKKEPVRPLGSDVFYCDKYHSNFRSILVKIIRN